MRQEHRAGEKLFVDFPGQQLPIYDRRTGEVALRGRAVRRRARRVELPLRRGGASQELVHWVTAHVHAFEVMGGVPEISSATTSLGGDKGAPLRARRQRHLPGDGRPLRRGHHPGPAAQAPRQGQGRSRRAAGRALDPGPAAQPALLLAWPRRTCDRRAGGADQRPAVQEDATGRAAELFEELERPALRPLPAERYEFGAWKTGQGQHRLPRRGPTVTTTRSPTSWWASVDVRTGRARSRSSTARRVASHVRSSRPRHTHRPGPHARGHRATPQWTPSRIVTWAEKTGPPPPRSPRRSWRARPIPSRATAPPRDHPPRRALRRRAPRGGLCPGAAACAPLTARSSRSCTTASTASPLPEPPPVAPTPATRTSAAPATTNERKDHHARQPDHRRPARPRLDGHGRRALLEQREHPDYDGARLRRTPRAARRPRAHRAREPPPGAHA